MTFAATVRAIYEDHGPDHILPFIGAAYEDASPSAFRVAVVGINAYVSAIDRPKLDPEWYPDWWRTAGYEKTHRFFNVAYGQADIVAGRLVQRSALVHGLAHDADPRTKAGFYATNAVKVFLGEEHKRSDSRRTSSPSTPRRGTGSWT